MYRHGLLLPTPTQPSTKKTFLQIFNECMSKTKARYDLRLTQHAEQHYLCHAEVEQVVFASSEITLGAKEARQRAAEIAVKDPRFIQVLGMCILKQSYDTEADNS